MTAAMRAASPPDAKSRRPKAVLSGSFRRDPDGLRDAFERLTVVADVLSPASLDFVGDWDGFVFTDTERALTPAEVEQAHLDAIEESDFVWLHAADGYVGSAATFEMGAAVLEGVPIFSATEPDDVHLRLYVEVVDNPAAAVLRLPELDQGPPASLRGLQHYYGRVAEQRGYTDETLQDTMLLLTEELGELARAIRKHVNLRRDSTPVLAEAASELADVQLYVLHLANLLPVDLLEAVRSKERINDERFRNRLASAG